MNSEEAETWATEILDLLAAELAGRKDRQDLEDFRRSVERLQGAAPGDEPKRSEFLMAAASIVAAAFHSRVGEWGRLIEWLYLYLDWPWFEKRKTPSASFDETPDLSARVLALLLAEALPQERSEFFHGIDAWEVLRVLSRILPEQTLGIPDAVALLDRVDQFTRRDGARHRIMAAVRAWVRRQPDLARSIVESWLEGRAEAAILEEPAIQELVEGIVSAGGEQSRPWRDSVLERLQEREDDAGLELALMVACFASPEPVPPAEERHLVLRRHFLRAPDRLAEAALRAALRDASEAPLESAHTASFVVKRLGSSAIEHSRLVAAVADVASKAVKEKGGDARALSFLLEDLLTVSPQEVSTSLDFFLSDLQKVDPLAVKNFLTKWLKRHSPKRSLRDLFHDTTGAMGEEGFFRFIVSCLLAPDSDLRAEGASLLNGSPRSELPGGILAELSQRQALALAHELIGCGVLGSVWVAILFQLLRERSDLRTEVAEIVLSDGMARYPGLCRDALAKLRQEGNALEPDLTRLGAVLDERLSSLDREHSNKQAVPEMKAKVSHPGARLWEMLERRQMASAMESAMADSFLSLFPSVPIARGEAAFLGPPEMEPVQLGPISVQMDYDLWSAFDPLGDLGSRQRHREVAEEKLQENATLP